ncbi:MAG: PilZ domain-containing protein [Desulfobacterales bacterium]|nr:PilZ domain-containing protein [Desulfobacterales bacterium]
MSNSDKRKHARYDTLNLFYITVLDGETVVHQGMGRTLNVSESGILLETRFSVKANSQVALSIGFEEEILEIQGQAVYCKPGDESIHETGVSFSSLEDRTRSILLNYIKAFQSQHTET